MGFKCEMKKDLEVLIKKGQFVTSKEIQDFFERYESLVSDTTLLRKEKMMADITLLLTLAEQRES